ncbi:hypothetical protein QE152_g8735 [Popillia japonica]|uniref:Reverse transcriptase domain-containing protein n=1 Tax=Popillia japonica TaxID=7064 RepID=A0AAW1LX45_POPJA
MVYLNGALSTPKNIKHGVAQRSLLGPFIFSLFVNDLPQCISGQLVQYALGPFIFSLFVNDLPQCISGQLVQYANDTTLLYRGSNHQQLEERGHVMLSEANVWFASNKLFLNKEEANVWFASNKLFLNKEKTTELVFTSKRNKTPKSAGYAKLLGTILDTRLTWRDEVDALSKKLSSVLYAIRRIHSITNKETAIVAYHALLKSYPLYSMPSEEFTQ